MLPIRVVHLQHCSSSCKSLGVGVTQFSAKSVHQCVARFFVLRHIICVPRMSTRFQVRPWNHQLFRMMNMKLIAASTSQHITHGLNSRHDSPTIIRMHPVFRLAFPCLERYPCPMKLPRQIKQQTLHLDAPIACSMGLRSQFHTVASTPFLLREWQCVVGCDVLEIDDVRAAVFADLKSAPDTQRLTFPSGHIFADPRASVQPPDIRNVMSGRDKVARSIPANPTTFLNTAWTTV